jgi:hypothetical protein
MDSSADYLVENQSRRRTRDASRVYILPHAAPHLAGRRHHRISPAAAIIIGPLPARFPCRRRHHAPPFAPPRNPSSSSASPPSRMNQPSHRRVIVVLPDHFKRHGCPSSSALRSAPAAARDKDPQMQMRHRCDGALLPQPAASWHPCPAPDEGRPKAATLRLR